jgi:sec-independent protein translocase protein TatA
VISRLGTTELILIFAIALVIFGPAKLPEIGKAVGKGIREFKSAASEMKSTMETEATDPAE